MKIDIVSDLHVEFNHSKFYKEMMTNSTSKKIIIAGDMGPIKLPEVQLAFTRLANKYEEVIYVPGNHDYYGNPITKGFDLLEEMEDLLPNLTILGPGTTAQVGDYKVIGDTLWVPRREDLRRYPISDLTQIGEILNYIDNMNSTASDYIYENADENTIVVTHHLPAPECIAPEWAGQGSNCWFMSDESRTIQDKKPFMWIFGHSHNRMDFTLGSTRMLNNAYGYPRENKTIERITYEL